MKSSQNTHRRARTAGCWWFVALLVCLLAACADEPPETGGAPEDGGSSTSSETSAETGGGGETGGGTNTGTTGSSTSGPCRDQDGDGFGEGCAQGPDCNDERADMNPNAEEVCDNVDNDCDGEADPGCTSCSPGLERSCFTADAALRGVGVCRGGFQVCSPEGTWGTCQGEVGPSDEICDGRDNDCDGTSDEELLNACGTCGTPPQEVCGDRLDNNCDGTIDESSAGCNCDNREQQPCYGGPPHTLGVGQCRGGLVDCEGQDWGACVGQVLPEEEVCDGIDNDCDGLIDEGLRNACGECGAPDPVEICNGIDDDCDSIVDETVADVCGSCAGETAAEECGNGVDDNCDGLVDEGCGCFGEETCYPGPPDTRGVGQCADGTRTCDREFWTECQEAVLPSVEICDGIDNDCDGLTDEGPNGCSICGPSEEVCDGVDNDCDGFIDEYVANSCGVCGEAEPQEVCDGIDNNCDGLIDEGLLNACGECGDSCYLEEWTTDNGRLDEGESQGLELDEGPDGGLRLGRSTFTLPYIWIANSNEDTVSKINTQTGEEEDRYTVGDNPSRTAVDLQGNVWVANRGSGDVHRVRLNDCEGQACVDPPIAVGNIPRGIAVDANNNVWVGAWTDKRISKINPNTMTVEAQVDVPSEIYGLAIDASGFLWVAERGGGLLSKIDTNTAQLVQSYTPPFATSLYGIAVDGEGNVWLGNYSEHNILKFNPNTEQWWQYRDANATFTRGVGVDGDGFVWVANSGTNNVSKFRATDGAYIGTYNVGTHPIGIGIDNDNNIWAVNRNSNDAYKISPTGQELLRVPVGSGPYTYSDMTGFQLRNFTVRQGQWTVTFDCGYSQCQFDTMEWEGSTPPETTLNLRIRTSADGTNWSPYSDPYSVSPATLSLPSGRYAEVEVQLQTTNDEVSPVFRGVSVDWQRP